MQISEQGVLAIQGREGFSLKAYPDPATKADPWTIGFGHTGPEVKSGVVWTKQQCHDQLAADLHSFCVGVSRAIGEAQTTQVQFDAMVSFAYNIGEHGFETSSVLKKHKLGDYEGAANAFALWNKPAMIISRRATEAKQYRGL